ncbi:hypothetical protein Peur_028285 [Populus x canadensis]
MSLLSSLLCRFQASLEAWQLAIFCNCHLYLQRQICQNPPCHLCQPSRLYHSLICQLCPQTSHLYLSPLCLHFLACQLCLRSQRSRCLHCQAFPQSQQRFPLSLSFPHHQLETRASFSIFILRSLLRGRMWTIGIALESLNVMLEFHIIPWIVYLVLCVRCLGLTF